MNVIPSWRVEQSGHHKRVFTSWLAGSSSTPGTIIGFSDVSIQVIHHGSKNHLIV
ncbi:MAG: hypothetical protein L3J39_15795 [Verrucomicrobiales bacterium]|nr:hypothetical protein [Verrucomicrobiales bacterium]